DRVLFSQKNIGGAELPGHRELRLQRIDGDDALGAGDARTLDHRESDAAATEYRDAGAGLHFGGVEDGADAGGDAAADERRTLEWDLRIHLDEVFGRDGGVLGHRAAAGEDVERLASRVAHARRALE